MDLVLLHLPSRYSVDYRSHLEGGFIKTLWDEIYLKRKFLIIGIAIFLLAIVIMNFGFNLNLSNLKFLGFKKDETGLERYGCLFRDESLNQRDYCNLLYGQGQLKEKALRASRAFDIPYSILFCMVLIESGFDHQAKSAANQGYGQFSPIAVRQSNKVMQKKRYQKMWEAYTDRSPQSLTVNNVMKSIDPEIPLGAIALYIRWMFDRIDQLNCSGCGTSHILTEKKIALMIASYNWSPYKLKVMAPLSLSEMTDPEVSPLPIISRKYILSMRNCRASGEFEKLRGALRVQDKRIKECQKKSFKSVCAKDQ